MTVLPLQTPRENRRLAPVRGFTLATPGTRTAVFATREPFFPEENLFKTRRSKHEPPQASGPVRSVNRVGGQARGHSADGCAAEPTPLRPSASTPFQKEAQKEDFINQKVRPLFRRIYKLQNVRTFRNFVTV